MRRFSALLAGTTVLAVSYQFTCKSESPRAQSGFKSRAQHLEEVRIDHEYDVVVIGGGCNGAGVLLDASTRGLRTLMIEKEDFSSGASSKSTKLIHGGVRYLQQVFEFSLASIASRVEKFGLVKEAIAERGMMIDSASHLTTKVPLVIPCGNLFSGLYFYVGSLMYYWIYQWYTPSTETQFKAPYLLNRQELIDIFPHLSPEYSVGVVYEDGSFNDARMCVSAILTATCGNGKTMPGSFVPGNAVNRAEFVEFIKDKQGKVKGVVFRDLLTLKEQRVGAKYVVNCTGAWADAVRQIDDPEAKPRICMVGGSHVVYDDRLASSTFGIAAPSADGRIILVQPWLGRILAGTTETTFTAPTNNPNCSDSERTFINKAMTGFMSGLDVGTFLQYQKTRYSGLRSLVMDDAGGKDTKTIARNHVIEESKSGLLSLMGGKWTIYRKMGEDLVNHIAAKEQEKGKTIPKCQTKGLKLLGSAPESLKHRLLKQKGHIGVQLYNTFGSLADEVSKGDLTPVYGSTTVAELEWIIKNQLVTSIEDVLMRRTRLCFLISKTDLLPLTEIVGRLMQRQLGWSESQTQAQITRSVQNIVRYEFD